MPLRLTPLARRAEHPIARPQGALAWLRVVAGECPAATRRLARANRGRTLGSTHQPPLGQRQHSSTVSPLPVRPFWLR